MDIDLHGYHPVDINLAALVRQAWEMGAPQITLIHGHGHNRGISAGFVNSNTGFFGMTIRPTLRHDPEFKPWIVRTSLDCGHDGSTTIRLRRNPKPTRIDIDMNLVGEPRFRR